MQLHFFGLLSFFLFASGTLSAQLGPDALRYLFAADNSLRIEIQGPDTLCLGETAYYEALGVGGDSVRFSTGENVRLLGKSARGLSLRFDQPGDYTLSASQQTPFGVARGRQRLHVAAGPNFDLGPDTVLCERDTFELKAPADARYRWLDGHSAATRRITESGTYTLVVRDKRGCVRTDRVRVKVLGAPRPDLGEDRFTCGGKRQRLDPGKFARYQWQDNSTDRYFNVTRAGTYRVKVTDKCGASATASVKIRESNVARLDLGNGGYLCQGDSVRLNAGDDFESYRWQDGLSRPARTISRGGIYTLTATDEKGCVVIDTVRFAVGPCVTDLALPAFFSPDGDQLNDEFNPTQTRGLRDIRAQVFDTDGTLLYFGSGNNFSWDGRFDGTLLPAGTYRYTVQYRNGSGEQFAAGRVEIIR